MFSISGQLERGGVVVVADDRGDLLQAGDPGRAPAALAGDQLVTAAGQGPHEHRLQHAALLQRRGERGQRLLVEVAPGLVRVGPISSIAT